MADSEFNLYMITFLGDPKLLLNKIDYQLVDNKTLSKLINRRVALLQDRGKDPIKKDQQGPREREDRLRRLVFNAAGLTAQAEAEEKRVFGVVVRRLVTSSFEFIEPGEDGETLGVTVRRDQEAISSLRIPITLVNKDQKTDIALPGNVVGLGFWRPTMDPLLPQEFEVYKALCVANGGIHNRAPEVEKQPAGFA